MLPTRKSISKKQMVLFLGDLLILIVTPLISVYVFYFLKFGFGFRIEFMRVLGLPFTSNILIFIISFYIMDLYDFKKDFCRKREIFNIFVAICMGNVGSVFFFYMIGMPPMGRSIVLIYSSILLVLLTCFGCLYTKMVVRGLYRKKAIIFGASAGGLELVAAMQDKPQLYIDIVGILDNEGGNKGECAAGVPWIYGKQPLSEMVRPYKPDLIILADRGIWSEEFVKDLVQCSQEGVEIRDMPGIWEQLEGRIPLDHVSNRWLLFSHLARPKFYFKRIKTVLDLVLTGALLIIAAPLMLLAAIAIKLDSRGPVLYRQRRAGKDGREFELVKFRSMFRDAEEKTGPVWAAEKRDPRVTRVGRVLRLLRLDELPQLFNVLMGDMSLIGPRPERPEFVADFIGENSRTDWIIPFYSERLSIKPGITGWAQVMYPYSSSREETIRKLEYDLFYIKNMSFFLDLSILLKTIRVVLFGKGAR